MCVVNITLIRGDVCFAALCPSSIAVPLPLLLIGHCLCSLRVTMLQTLIRSIVVVLVLGAGVNAQTSRAGGSADASLNERAKQLEPYIADSARRYGVVNPHDPRQAIGGAARYLRDLLNRFEGRVDLAMAAYNSGEGTVESFLTGRSLLLPNGKLINPRRRVTGGIPPYVETREYVRQGLALLLEQEPSQTSLPGRSATLRLQTHLTRRDFSLDSFADGDVIGGKSQLRVASFIDVP